MYKKAAQLKLRFPSTKGNLTVEQLFDLPLTSESRDSLNSIAITVNKELKQSSEESFVTTVSPTNTLLQLRLDILKDVIATRQAENVAKVDAKLKRQRKEHLRKLIEEKSLQEDGKASKEELLAEYNSL